jgi:hypothetical protein
MVRKIVLLQDEVVTLRALAEKRGLTPGETLRTLILGEAYRQRLVQNTHKQRREVRHV